ncbi:VCBS repeat-containing protein [Streptomyces sp. NPDC005576]|uniref:FG-GAP repeat domain-containing protein n=1 Tax=unclassified Streptomyces TaxID=2593676 RepID=UPI003403B1AD
MTITARAAGNDAETADTAAVPGGENAAAPQPRNTTARSTTAFTAAQRADFDFDGAGDRVYRKTWGDVWIEEDFSRAIVTPRGNAQVRDLMLPGDMTGDSMPDLLTLTATGDLCLHSGGPSATRVYGLAGHTTLSSGWQAYNKLVVPGDLNGDGKPDLLARSTAGLFLFPGTGTNFGKGIQVGGAGWSQFDQLVGADDLTGDGLADLVTRNASGLFVYPSNGEIDKYPFQAPIQIGGTGWLQYNQLAGGTDYNGNGTADLLARGYDGRLYSYDGKGTGTFKDRALVGDDYGAIAQLAGAGNMQAFGKTGIVARNDEGTLYRYTGTGLGTLEQREQIGLLWATQNELINSVALRADGWPTVIKHDTYGGHLYNTSEYANNDTDLAAGSKSYNLVVGPGDLNGDGKSDLLARSSTALYFYAGNGDGLSMKGRVQVGGSGWSQYNKLVGAGDYNLDGRADLLARSSAGLFLYPGTGKAATPFGARVQVGGPGWSQYTNLAAPGDINGDGIADLLTSNSKGQLFFYAGTGVTKTPLKARVLIDGGGWNQYPDLL